jgi:hypothetical protein
MNPIFLVLCLLVLGLCYLYLFTLNWKTVPAKACILHINLTGNVKSDLFNFIPICSDPFWCMMNMLEWLPVTCEH